MIDSLRRTRPVIGLALLVAILAPGCAVWEFTETRYQNATGFFNTYYNASKLFSDSEEEIKKDRKLVDNTAISTLTVPGEDPGAGGMSDVGAAPVVHGVVSADGQTQGADGGMMPPEKVMPRMPEGGAMKMPILTSQRGGPGAGQPLGVPSTALDNLEKVIAKCSRILVDYRKSKWVDNALLLIGKAYYYKQEYTKAERKFKELLDGFPESQLRAEAMLWYGKNSMQMDLFEEAETQLNEAIALGIEHEEEDVVAEAYLVLGNLFKMQQLEVKAMESFRKGTAIETESDLRVELYLSLAREQEKTGDQDGALASYRALARSSSDRDVLFYAEINYARLSREMKRIDDAVNMLVDMLDNPTYIEYDGQIQLEIGRLYEAVEEFPAAVDQYRYVDTTFRARPEAAEASYALAKMYETKGNNYDKAFEHYSNARTAYPGIAAATLGGRRADMFGDYRKLRNKMFDLDTLLFYVLYPDSLTARDSVRAIADSLTREETKRSGGGGLTADQKYQERLSRRRPHGRNTGRVNPAAPAPSPGMSPMAMTGPATPSAASGTQPLYRRLNIRKLSPDSVLQALSIARMDVGWVMLDRIENLDSALYYYRLALEGSLPDSVLANGLYTLAEISRRMGDTVLAKDYEDRLVNKLPHTRFAQNIMIARGMPVPKDSMVVFREAYDRAAILLERGTRGDAVAALERMRQSYPHNDQAVRAQLAIAMTYEDMPGRGDTALAIYRRMLIDHPNSRYTQRARDVIAALDRGKLDEEERIKKEKEAEVRKLEEQRRLEMEAKKRKPDVVTHRDTTTLRFQKKKDPTLDEDFPLSLPGDKPKKEPPKSEEPKPGLPPPLPGDAQPEDPLSKPPQPGGEQPDDPLSKPPPGEGETQPLSVPQQTPGPPPPSQQTAAPRGK